MLYSILYTVYTTATDHHHSKTSPPLPGIITSTTIIIHQDTTTSTSNKPSILSRVDEEGQSNTSSSSANYSNISVVQEIIQRVVLPYVSVNKRQASGATEHMCQSRDMLIKGE